MAAWATTPIGAPDASASTMLHGQRLAPPFESFFVTGDPPVIRGDWIAVHGGVPGANDAVLLYRRQAGVWSHAQTLTEPPPVKGIPDRFGNTLAMGAQGLFVGDPSYYDPDTDTYTGAVFVYTLQDGKWQLAQAIYRHIDSGQFPGVLAVIGDTLYVGVDDAVSPDYGQTGAIEAHDVSSIPASFIAELLPTPPAGANGHARFGSRIVGAADMLAVGAPCQNFDSVVGDCVGAAYVFSRSGNQWMQQSVLMSPSPHVGGAFASSLAIDGNRVIGAEVSDAESVVGVAHSYVPGSAGLAYEGTILPAVSAPYDDFGQALAAQDGLLLVGDPGRGTGGLVYAFRHTAAGWYTAATFITDSEPGGLFGLQVAIDGSTLVVGTNEDDEPWYPPWGALYVFDSFPTDWIFADGLDP